MASRPHDLSHLDDGLLDEDRVPTPLPVRPENAPLNALGYEDLEEFLPAAPIEPRPLASPVSLLRDVMGLLGTSRSGLAGRAPEPASTSTRAQVTRDGRVLVELSLRPGAPTVHVACAELDEHDALLLVTCGDGKPSHLRVLVEGAPLVLDARPRLVPGRLALLAFERAPADPLCVRLGDAAALGASVLALEVAARR